MGEKIRLEMNDWLYNAGLVGLYNILKHVDDRVYYNGDTIEFDESCLKEFEEKYYKYFCDTYEPVMVYSKLVKKIQHLIENCNEEIDSKEYKDEIKYIKDKLSNAAYRDIKNSTDMKQLSNPTVSFLKDLLEKVNTVKSSILQKETTGYYDQKGKVSKSPNAIIDKYVNTNVLKVDGFSQDVLDYIEADKKNFKYECFTCGNKIKNVGSGLSFLNNMYFDTARKTSHVWNFNSDIEICPICRLVYFCVPAGFTTVYGKGVYINITTDIMSAIDVNNKLRMEILNEKELGRNLAYKGLVRSIQEQSNKDARYELADIQVVRCENDTYRFNILSKRVLKTLIDSKLELDSIINCGFNEVNTYFSIYELVVKKILSNENLFILIYKLLQIKLSSPLDCRFNGNQLLKVQKINFNFLEGIGYMGKEDKDMIRHANAFGYYLKENYKSRNVESKLSGISYRLLNALKTNNKDMFMDTILNCYLYAKKEVPQIFLEALKSSENFKTVGYAFVTGLIDGKREDEKNKNNGGDK